MKQRYSRVPTNEEENRRAANKKRRSEAAEQIATKIQALAWVLVGAFVTYETDLPFVLLSDPDVNRFWFNIAAACFTMNSVLCFYLTIWLPYIQRVTTEWNVFCPRVIPTMTAIGVICGFSHASRVSNTPFAIFRHHARRRLIRGLWPVWGLLTPFILALVFMACLMSLHFIPWPL